MRTGNGTKAAASPQVIISALRSTETFPQCQSVDPSTLSSFRVLAQITWKIQSLHLNLQFLEPWGQGKVFPKNHQGFMYGCMVASLPQCPFLECWQMGKKVWGLEIAQVGDAAREPTLTYIPSPPLLPQPTPERSRMPAAGQRCHEVSSSPDPKRDPRKQM